MQARGVGFTQSAPTSPVAERRVPPSGLEAPQLRHARRRAPARALLDAPAPLRRPRSPR